MNSRYEFFIIIFSLFVPCLFTLRDDFFDDQRLLILMKYYLTIFSLRVISFVSIQNVLLI